MSFNFDNSSFNLHQAGLELSLSDFAFDPAQATQVQQHLQQQHQQHQQQQQQQQQQHHQQQQQQQLQQQHQQKQLQQQEQRQLQNLLLHDDPSQNLSAENQTQRQQIMNNEPPSTSSSYEFTPSMTADMMASISASASTTPLFQTHPDKIAKSSGANLNATSLQQQLQQQHRQQQLFLQQQQQRQQQQLLQQQQQQLQQFPQTQTQVSKEGTRQQLLTPVGSEYYTSDYTQYMSPLGIQPMTTSEATVDVSDQFEEEDEVQFTPLISPAMTPSHPYSNVAAPMSTSNEIFSPLTSPALQPHRTSQIDYLSFSGPGFSSLPIQFQQAHQVQQQQIQQLQLLQSQAQVEPQQQQQQLQHQQLQLQHDQQKKLTNQLQQQLQRQHQLQQQQQRQGQGTKHALVDTKNPAQNSQRPPMKRRNTVERDGANGQQSTSHSRSMSGVSGGGGPVRTAVPKSSPAMRPMISHPISPTGLRKQNTSAPGRSRSSSTLAPLSPMAIQFPTSNGRPTPSPIMTGTSQPQALQTTSLAHSQPSPSPLLVTNMNHLSMMPPSPAPFVLPASSMIPLKDSPMILPMQQSQGQVQAPRQLRISQPVQVQQQQQLQVVQLQPQQRQSPPTAPQSAQSSQAPSSSAPLTQANTTDVIMGSDSQQGSSTPSSGNGTPKSALAPVTPASLMNLSSSEATPTSSPKVGANHAKSKSLMANKSNQNGTRAAGKEIAAAGTKSGATSSSSSTASSSSTPSNSGPSKRAVGRRHVSGTGATAGPLAPRTPGTTAILAPMPPPSAGFSTLISPALKPTLMPQPPLHRGSISGQAVLVSPRVQPLLVSPSLKPWLPGVSTSEAMARLASKSNYQNILDGDHTALGLSYNTDLHSGIELRRTSHKAAEQKRRDSLKHCFEDLRQMIPNIVDKAPSKVFLLKKSFDHICELKSDLAKQNLLLARIQAQQQFFQQNLQQWMSTLPQDLLPSPSWEQAWKMTEEALDTATAKELQATRVAAEMAEQSALAVERARVGNPPSGGNKEGGKPTAGSHGPGGPGGSQGGQSSSGSDPTTTSTSTAAAASEGNYRLEKDDHDPNRDEDDGDESEEENEMIRKSQPDAPKAAAGGKNEDEEGVVQSLSVQSDKRPSATHNRQETTMPVEEPHHGAAIMRKVGDRRARSRSARSGQRDEAEESEEEEEEEEEEQEDEEREEGEGEEEEEEVYAEDKVDRSGIQDQEMTDVSDRPA
ncbi:hypothetical protein BGZ75_005092 [Mortierella antarctica]|nr:hypothetical protein BGZ75_005092 [Mortierella antarctica]